MDVGAWLHGLGLGQYEASFRDNEIDDALLPKLTVDDLKDLGVAIVGHRRKILSAIEELNAPPRPRPEPAGIAPAAASGDSAERRPITVMFCDLVGSTSLSSKLDAEDWRDLVGGYLDEASKAVTDFGGHVLKKLGDGIMALFGYPQAQENDAERAARAGLAIFGALDELNARNVARGLPALAARIGLESGPVVVDQTGEVFGDAPNIAARVQSAAEPGTLLVTAGVQRQVAGLFVVEDKGPHELKGVAGKPNLYRIVRASGSGRRLRARSLTPLVGRDDERALLLRRWQRVREGEGQLLQIVGEPGLGKSRLMEEFRLGLAEAPHTWIEWSSSQLLQNTPLHPFAEWGRQRFGGADVPVEQRLGELEAVLAQAKLDPAEHAPLIAPLLDIPVPDAQAAKLAPEEMRRRQLAAIVAWLLASARTQPLALAFEDLHWADPTSLDLMKTLAERGAQAPMMIVATARPEFRAPWTTRSHHGILSLIPLDRAQIRKMVSTLAERHALSKDTIEGLADRTGGVPLFVEEVTRLMLEGGAQTIPPTLQQSLAARLDRLGEAREVAQIGAVLGRAFSYALLQAVAGLPALALSAALEKLVEADLLYVEGSPPSAIYRFKHALIQDAAYDSLLKNRRQALHRHAAEALVKNPEPQPELVAHHFTQSGQSEPAIEWWGKAGDAALRRSAFQEAISHLGKAIEMADKAGAKSASEPSADGAAAPAKRESDTRAQLHSGYALASMMTKGFSADDTQAALTRAGSYAEGTRTPHYWTLQYGRISADMMRGEAQAARAGAEAFITEAESLGLQGHAGYGRRTLGFLKLMAGDFVEACADLQRVIVDAGDDTDDGLRALFGTDLRCYTEGTLGHAIWYLGQADEARRLCEVAFRGASERGQPSTQAAALFCHFVTKARCGLAERVLPVAEDLLALSQTHNLGYWRTVATNFMDWARGRLGRADAAEAFRAARSVDPNPSAKLVQALNWALLADLEAALGRPEASLAAVETGLAMAAETGEGWMRTWLLRLRGETLASRDPAGAEAAYREALEVAVSQGARAEVLLTALALAKLYQSIKRLRNAHDVLGPALEGFSPTPEFPAIAEAQARLAELGEQFS